MARRRKDVDARTLSRVIEICDAAKVSDQNINAKGFRKGDRRVRGRSHGAMVDVRQGQNGSWTAVAEQAPL